MNCSICICTYNGQEFIGDQLESILSQIKLSDEIIVIDDCSSDSTVKLIKKFNDSRIKVVVNDSNLGPVKSFEKAIKYSNNDIIFLSDQDDMWIEDRFQLMTNTLCNSDAFLLSSNSIFINKFNSPINFMIDGVLLRDSNKYFKNIVNIFIGKTNYYGCCMAFKKELIDLILPIPRFVESHDLWMAMCSNLAKKNIHMEEPSLKRRIHGNNASVISRNNILKLYSRLLFFIQIFVIYRRLILKKWKII